jgi:hypothetical protein
VLPLKNQLSTADAQTVETAFAAKLSQLDDATTGRRPQPVENNGHDGHNPGAVLGADGGLTISKPVPDRDRNHLRFVTSQPCVVCGRIPSDPHHIKFAEQRTMGRKVSDKFTVPICRVHHRELHQRGSERAWWRSQGIDPLPIAATLWKTTHEIESAAAEIAGDNDRPGRFNGSSLANESATVRRRNDETKPIVGPEAE